MAGIFIHWKHTCHFASYMTCIFYKWHESFIRVTCMLSMWRNSFICVTCMLYMWHDSSHLTMPPHHIHCIHCLHTAYMYTYAEKMKERDGERERATERQRSCSTTREKKQCVAECCCRVLLQSDRERKKLQQHARKEAVTHWDMKLQQHKVSRVTPHHEWRAIRVQLGGVKTYHTWRHMYESYMKTYVWVILVGGHDSCTHALIPKWLIHMSSCMSHISISTWFSTWRGDKEPAWYLWVTAYVCMMRGAHLIGAKEVSWHTYLRVTAHICMIHGAHARRDKEPPCDRYLWVMVLCRDSWICVTCILDSWRTSDRSQGTVMAHIYVWVTAHICMIHYTQLRGVNEPPRETHVWVMAHIMHDAQQSPEPTMAHTYESQHVYVWWTAPTWEEWRKHQDRHASP